jgi:PIN domain nuclease of toxin-antitoxin system
MRLLLDTHVLLWALGAPQRLSAVTRKLIEDPANEVLFSAASIWEIAIKASRGRPDFDADPSEVAKSARATGFSELPIDAEAAAMVAILPAHHRDPFDRLLVAQAMAGPMRLYTADPVLAVYSELITLVP